MLECSRWQQPTSEPVLHQDHVEQRGQSVAAREAIGGEAASDQLERGSPENHHLPLITALAVAAIGRALNTSGCVQIRKD